jgi:hypothetical protein
MKSNLPEGESGPWKIERFTIPKESIEGLRCFMQGRPVIPGEYTRLMRGHTVVMSDTPSEIRDLWPFAHALRQFKARRVLINGLGLGVALNIALSESSVALVDVVEADHHVMRLVQPFIHDARVQWHLGDALSQDWPKGMRWDVVWHDIWDNIPNSDNLEQVTCLKRKYGRRCEWQGVWCESYARRDQRRASLW